MHPSTKSRLVALLVVLACAFSIAQAETEDKREYFIDPAATTINGITITSTESKIIGRLGKPKSVENSYDEPMTKPSKTLRYDGMKIYVIEGKIYNLSCTGKKCQTERGVKIGDSNAKVVKIYGPGNSYSKDTLSYTLKGTDSHLIFKFKDGITTEIMFWVNYT
jgi:hypothetical protein